MALANRGAARCIEEKDLTPDVLWGAMTDIVDHPDVLHDMAAKARGAAILDAADRIYDVIKTILAKR